MTLKSLEMQTTYDTANPPIDDGGFEFFCHLCGRDFDWMTRCACSSPPPLEKIEVKQETLGEGIYLAKNYGIFSARSGTSGRIEDLHVR